MCNYHIHVSTVLYLLHTGDHIIVLEEEKVLTLNYY